MKHCLHLESTDSIINIQRSRNFIVGTDLNLDYLHGMERINHVLARKTNDINLYMTVQRQQTRQKGELI